MSERPTGFISDIDPIDRSHKLPSDSYDGKGRLRDKYKKKVKDIVFAPLDVFYDESYYKNDTTFSFERNPALYMNDYNPSYHDKTFASRELDVKKEATPIYLKKDAWYLGSEPTMHDPDIEDDDPLYKSTWNGHFKAFGRCNKCKTYYYPKFPISEYQKYQDRMIPADTYCFNCGTNMGEPGAFMYAWE